MSVDPAAVAASSAGGTTAVDTLIAAELQALAADAQALQAQVAIGDTVTATVLPSNGLGDLISVLGNRVVASLPPTLSPGDTITARVTGFNGDQILLHILSSDGSVPVTGGQIATLATPAPPASSGGIAPPSAVFVAATVRPGAPVPAPIPPGATPAEPSATSEASAAPGTIPGAPGATLTAQVFGGIEARLAAARAAAVSILAPANLPLPAAPPSTAAAPGGSVTTAPGSPSVPASALPIRPFILPPPIATRYLDAFPASTTASASAPGAAPTSTAALPPGTGGAAGNGAVSAGATPAPATSTPAASAAAFQSPLALVRALQLPVTPTNLAAATLALNAPGRLPAALATLESALPNGDDPRVATYRAIAGFIGRISPSSPQLATQIAAYVEHVVAGSEPVLAQLLNARLAAAPANAAPAATPASVVAEQASPSASGGAESPATASAAATAEPTLPATALAQIVERAANIASSLKEQLFQLIGGAPAGSSEATVPAAASALTAITAVQLGAATAAAATPGTISFAIPMFLGASGFAQAQLHVDRDAPEGANVPLDGDNFHIAFVLDTKNLGTVAIDLRTVGRAFSLSVKTETLRTAQRFGDELSRLTDRLGSLRYEAKSVEAVVAAPTAVTSTIAPVVASERRSNDDDSKFSERA